MKGSPPPRPGECKRASRTRDGGPQQLDVGEGQRSTAWHQASHVRRVRVGPGLSVDTLAGERKPFGERHVSRPQSSRAWACCGVRPRPGAGAGAGAGASDPVPASRRSANPISGLLGLRSVESGSTPLRRAVGWASMTNCHRLAMIGIAQRLMRHKHGHVRWLHAAKPPRRPERCSAIQPPSCANAVLSHTQLLAAAGSRRVAAYAVLRRLTHRQRLVPRRHVPSNHRWRRLQWNFPPGFIENSTRFYGGYQARANLPDGIELTTEAFHLSLESSPVPMDPDSIVPIYDVPRQRLPSYPRKLRLFLVPRIFRPILL